VSGVITHLARAEGLANPWRVVAGAVVALYLNRRLSKPSSFH
jgi:hypothetical protein